MIEFEQFYRPKKKHVPPEPIEFMNGFLMVTIVTILLMVLREFIVWLR